MPMLGALEIACSAHATFRSAQKRTMPSLNSKPVLLLPPACGGKVGMGGREASYR